jgi:RimJ/RimL family protein N-acetyltransferase
MPSLSTKAIKKSLQKWFWIYLTNNFLVTRLDDLKPIEAAVRCEFLPITLSNYSRVMDFRDESRVPEYREKLANKETGFFVQSDEKMIGSIWATINNTDRPLVVRSYVKLVADEALVHDIVTGEQFRGMGVGPFMVGRICTFLLTELGVSKIIIDVNVRNSRSLRMMNKTGLRPSQKMLSISAFGKLMCQMSLRQSR